MQTSVTYCDVPLRGNGGWRSCCYRAATETNNRAAMICIGTSQNDHDHRLSLRRCSRQKRHEEGARVAGAETTPEHAAMTLRESVCIRRGDRAENEEELRQHQYGALPGRLEEAVKNELHAGYVLGEVAEGTTQKSAQFNS